MGVKGRLAPSPTGRMHAGNILAGLAAWVAAKESGGTVVLRMEDLDSQRSRKEYADQIMSDFEALGLTWDEGPYYQSSRTEYYAAAFAELDAANVVYPCFCSRSDIHAASAPHEGSVTIYPGTCRNLSPEEAAGRKAGRSPSFRLRAPEGSVCFEDLLQGSQELSPSRNLGDVVLKRADGNFAYHLAVVVDDALMGIDSVFRGCDLLASAALQWGIQETLGFPHPAYGHVPLLTAADGRRLSKRDGDAGMDALLDRHGSARAIIGSLCHLIGFTEEVEEVHPADLLGRGFLDCLKGKKQVLWKAGSTEAGQSARVEVAPKRMAAQ